jgi:alcohol dehydrogenase class IV
MWSEKAMTLLAGSFRQAVRHGDDKTARTQMAMAATFAGMGFGNAGVHIPHANGYPIAGRVKDFHPKDYPQDAAMVPHGISVGLTAPESFRFTFDAAPERHLRSARLLAPDADATRNPAEFLPSVLIALMRDIDFPNGLGAVGYDDADVDGLVEGTMRQHRLLATAPKPVTEEDVATILRRSMTLW